MSLLLGATIHAGNEYVGRRKVIKPQWPTALGSLADYVRILRLLVLTQARQHGRVVISTTGNFQEGGGSIPASASLPRGWPSAKGSFHAHTWLSSDKVPRTPSVGGYRSLGRR